MAMTAMTFNLKLAVSDANHLKHLLEKDARRCEQWITAAQTTDEERESAQVDYAINERLLRQFS
jgi:hypothetical protein